MISVATWPSRFGHSDIQIGRALPHDVGVVLRFYVSAKDKLSPFARKLVFHKLGVATGSTASMLPRVILITNRNRQSCLSVHWSNYIRHRPKSESDWHGLFSIELGPNALEYGEPVRPCPPAFELSNFFDCGSATGTGQLAFAAVFSASF